MPDASRHWTRLTYKPMERIVESRGFGASAVALILVNVGLMMCEEYPMEPRREALLEAFNFVITLLFALEMVRPPRLVVE